MKRAALRIVDDLPVRLQRARDNARVATELYLRDTTPRNLILAYDMMRELLALEEEWNQSRASAS